MKSDPQAGEKRAGRITIVDVARHAGVSTASVSKVLRDAYGVSDAMKERVSASMDELKFRPHRPARGMRGRTYTIGMLVADIENPFFSLLCTGLSRHLGANDYEVLVAPGGYTTSSQRTMINAMIDHQMDGLVLVSPRAADAEIEAFATEVPVVQIGRHSESALLDSVSGDDALGAQLVVDHFVRLGHRRIAFVMNAVEGDDPGLPEQRRLRGFRNAMASHGLADEAVVVTHEWSLEGGRRAARELTSMEQIPTAVHAGADVAAFGILNGLWDRGLRAPEVFSLAGYDNSTTSGIGPISLTTVDQAGLQMGALAAELLLDRISGRTESRHEILEPSLVIRSTTAAPART